ncbi:MAG: hypothetical protein LUI12_01815 [Clostridiales bacterium]|nr:hypothetical protein [Clostridiales bacterium]
MEWLVENLFILISLLAVLFVAIYAVYKFWAFPTEKQIEKVREWLLYAVSVAEQELGSGTGKLKLRYVYDWFLKVFPWLAKIISFETFSGLVDESLVEMKKLIETNEKVKDMISA